MLFRKVDALIEAYLTDNSGNALLIEGARRVGKTYTARNAAYHLFKSRFEINLLDDYNGDRMFANVKTETDFYLRLNSITGNKLNYKGPAIVLLDDIHVYPQLIPLLDQLAEAGDFRYIACSSISGLVSPSMEHISTIKMYPLDFEEFLYANGYSTYTVNSMRKAFDSLKPLSDSAHRDIMHTFLRYLIVGGLPDSINTYIADELLRYTAKPKSDVFCIHHTDIAEYDRANNRKALRVYDCIPAAMRRKKKRIVAQYIEGVKGKKLTAYRKEFDYLSRSGVVLRSRAVSAPLFPLSANVDSDLIKLYLCDHGILSSLLYSSDTHIILAGKCSIPLNAVFETAVAGELAAHGHGLFYYDNRNNGEVDFLIEDVANSSVIPIVVKSGKDYSVHSAISTLVSSGDYPVERAYILSNKSNVSVKGKVIHIPVYYAMFL